jgi:Uncharacterised nucleotidyltransferase
MRQPIPPQEHALWAGSIYPPRIQELLVLLAKIISGEPQKGLGGLNASAVAALREHRLTPWLYREAAQQGWKKYCPASVWEDLRQDYLSSLITTRIQQEKIIEVIKALRQANLEVILLKGADIQHRLYGDPEVRPMVDLDVLLGPDDLPRAARVLAGIGYRLAPKYRDPAPGYWQLLGEAVHYINPTDNLLLVDLHWEIGAMMYYYRIPYAPLRRDAQSISYNGSKVYILSSEHLLIHLGLNAHKDLLCAVLRVLDLILLLSRQSVDWRRVMQEAAAFGCQRPVYLTLREVARVAPKLVPRQVLMELARYRPPFTEMIILHGRLRFMTLGLASFYRHRSLRDWAYVVKATLWPNPDYLMAAYGSVDHGAHLRHLLALYSGSSQADPQMPEK